MILTVTKVVFKYMVGNAETDDTFLSKVMPTFAQEQNEQPRLLMHLSWITSKAEYTKPLPHYGSHTSGLFHTSACIQHDSPRAHWLYKTNSGCFLWPKAQVSIQLLCLISSHVRWYIKCI